MGLKTFGLMAVDWEERVNIERLRQERLARVKNALKKSEIGALLCFDMNNIRYITATHIGTWAMDKLVRFSLLPQDDEPILWDFGSAARHHQIYCPWLGERSRRHLHPAWCDQSGVRPGRRCREKDQVGIGAAQFAKRADRRRCDRDAGALRAPSARP
jgi:hypothetical protein